MTENIKLTSLVTKQHEPLTKTIS